ncbi:hypothetical protein EVAR_86169_1 [Eumeta japonica]|uniref:Uncharacterized protein n=1 Tax=Eumeta variegata TaxID=151549 RepID=A0A4C2A416_EUMVA|nr:hypothetical protein EVAR_86169_1 [Eumeta japonica]
MTSSVYFVNAFGGHVVKHDFQEGRKVETSNWKVAQCELKKDISIHSSSSDDHKEVSTTFKRKKKTRAEYQKEYRQRLKEKNTPTQTEKSEEQRKRKAANSKAYRERKKRLREEGILALTQKSDEQRKRKAANSKAYRERKKRLRVDGIRMQKYSARKSSILQTQRENPFETVSLIHEARTSGPNENEYIERRTKMDNPSVTEDDIRKGTRTRVGAGRSFKAKDGGTHPISTPAKPDPDSSTSWIMVEEEKIPPKLTLESIGLRRNNHKSDLNLEESLQQINDDSIICGVNSNNLEKFKTEPIQQNGSCYGRLDCRTKIGQLDEGEFWWSTHPLPIITFPLHPYPAISSIGYPIHIQKAGNALLALLELRVSVDGGGHLH